MRGVKHLGGGLRARLLVCVCAAVVLLGAGQVWGQLSAQDIEDLRAEGEASGWTFEVSQNDATQYPLEDLCGFVKPDNWRELGQFDTTPPRRDLPSTFDWRDYGGQNLCTPVKNQGGCGSCWAFSTVGPLECNIKIQTGVTVDLSEQWLVSCNRDGWDCTGGFYAHDYHQAKGDQCYEDGAVLEQYFPYVAYDATCNCPYPHDYWIEDWFYVSGTNAMKQAIMDYGPISVDIVANSALQAYSGGIFNGCTTGYTNHAVVVVGWDDDQAGGVWFMRNSWGQYWGEDGGYCRIPYGCSNIGDSSCYVVYDGNPLALTFTYPDGIPTMASPNEPTTWRVQVSADTGTPIDNTGQLHYRLDGGSWHTTAMTRVSANLYEASLPLADCYSTYDWYVTAFIYEGGTGIDPEDAPMDYYSMTVATALATVFEDNFQTNKGWTVENSGLTDGPWDRGVPVDCDRGDPPSDYDGSGMCYLTDNSAASECNSDVDGGYTWLISPTLNMSAGDGVVSFALWYTNDFGADPDNDVFKIYVSNNNGSSWILVETVGPQSSSGWTVHSFTVGDYVTPTSQVKVRFEASDLNSGSVVEAGIDDFKVAVTDCQVIPPEACCFLGNGCDDLLPDTCTAQGGIPQGEGTSCATAECPRACCFGDTSCEDLEPSECVSQGGTPWSVGTSCATVTCPPEDERVINITFDTPVNPNAVCPGSTFEVTVQLSSLNGDLEDLRLLQFASHLSSGNLTLNSITWDLQVTSMDLYILDSDLSDPYQVFSAAYSGVSSVPGYIVDLDGTPQTVARLNVTYQGGDATLNVLGSAANEPDLAVWFRAGFESVASYWQSNGGVAGGTLTFHEGSCADLHIVSSDPGDGWIDARRPTDPDGTGVFGWSAVDITFDGDASGLTPADFTTSETCDAGACDGVAPSVAGVGGAGAALTVTLDRPIDPVAWTTIAMVGGDASDVVRLGYLPADADASLMANANDIIEVVDAVTSGGELYHCDIDRSGAITANDIVELVNLLNGAGGYDAYYGQALPALP